MGKKLIIKGADFSEVAVDNYITWIQKATPSGSLTTNNNIGFQNGAVSAWGCCARSTTVNKPINVVKVHLYVPSNVGIVNPGTLRIIKLVKGTSAVTGTYTTYATFTYNADDCAKGYKIVYLDDSITLASTDEAIAVCRDNTTGGPISSNLSIDTGASHGNISSLLTQTAHQHKNLEPMRCVMTSDIRQQIDNFLCWC